MLDTRFAANGREPFKLICIECPEIPELPVVGSAPSDVAEGLLDIVPFVSSNCGPANDFTGNVFKLSIVKDYLNLSK